MAVDQFKVHIQIFTRDQHGFTDAVHDTLLVLDEGADNVEQQLDAIREASTRCQAEWADRGNPLSLF